MYFDEDRKPQKQKTESIKKPSFKLNSQEDEYSLLKCTSVNEIDEKKTRTSSILRLLEFSINEKVKVKVSAFDA